MDMFYVHDDIVITSGKEDMFSSFVCMLAKKVRTDLHEIFREGCQWANEQIIKFRWRSGSPSRYRICFPASSLLGDTKVFMKVLVILIRQMVAVVRRSLTEVYTVPVLLVLTDFIGYDRLKFN